MPIPVEEDLNAPPPKVSVRNSVLEMVSSMMRYNIPPQFNFLKYNDPESRFIKPFAMYIFEFEHNLSRQDLTDIWQNLPPVTYKSFDQKEKTISHSLSTNELMGYANLGKEGVPFQEKTQWMVFKVKQKARTNYFDKVSTTRSGTELKILEQNPGLSSGDILGGNTPTQKVGNELSTHYSYNWPYDFVSTIEMCKIDCSIEFSEEEEPDTTQTQGQELSLDRGVTTQQPQSRGGRGSRSSTEQPSGTQERGGVNVGSNTGGRRRR